MQHSIPDVTQKQSQRAGQALLEQSQPFFRV